MKLNTTTLILGVAMVVAGLFSATAFGLIGTKTDAQTGANAAGYITGHVTTIVNDAAGNIKEYRQSDNIIVNGGENCVLKMLFHHGGGETTGTTVCTGANTDGYRYIQIGNATHTAVATDDRLGNPHNSTSFPGTAGAGLLIRAGTPTWTNSTLTGATSQAKVVLSATFTNDAATSQTVAESGLWNSTTADTNSLFARQTFNAITLNNNDSLTVQWTINVGGTTSFTGQ